MRNVCYLTENRGKKYQTRHWFIFCIMSSLGMNEYRDENFKRVGQCVNQKILDVLMT